MSELQRLLYIPPYDVANAIINAHKAGEIRWVMGPDPSSGEMGFMGQWQPKSEASFHVATVLIYDATHGGEIRRWYRLAVEDAENGVGVYLKESSHEELDQLWRLCTDAVADTQRELCNFLRRRSRQCEGQQT